MDLESLKRLGAGPIRYLFLFLVIVLTFAAIYTAIPGDFYYEHIGIEKQIRVLTNYGFLFLEEAFQDAIASSGGIQLATDLTGHCVFLSQPDATAAGLQMKLSIFLVLGTGSHVLLTVPVLAELPGREVRGVDLTTSKEYDYFVIRIHRAHGAAIDVRDIYNGQAIGSYELGMLDWEVKLEKDEYDLLASVRAALLGYGARIPGRFARMIYFSLVTITTLGFGDIVPLTDLARALVGLESFSGIVLLGLFVNSVFARSRRHF